MFSPISDTNIKTRRQNKEEATAVYIDGEYVIECYKTLSTDSLVDDIWPPNEGKNDTDLGVDVSTKIVSKLGMLGRKNAAEVLTQVGRREKGLGMASGLHFCSCMLFMLPDRRHGP